MRGQTIKKNCSLISLTALFFYTGCNNNINNNRTWNVYKADAESSSYSPLKEINKENVQQLKMAWIFNPNDTVKGSSGFGNSECNPIL